MYNIIDVDTFKIFKASQHAQELYGPLIREAGSSNQHFLETASPLYPKMPITGSFVYAHPPNYRGLPALGWGVAQWRSFLRKIRAFGMDTVIFQAALWNELQECYYPSRVFASYKTWNVIEPFLEAAREEQITVFIGGYGSTTGWNDHLDPEKAAREERACIDCLTELLRYREAFEGFYFSPETAYTGSLNRTKIARLNRIYRVLFNHIKAADDAIRILISPATKYFQGKEREMEEHWLAVLDGVPLDILAPQDSIGTCGSRLCQAERMYQVWKELCLKQNINLWANIELFERKDLSLLNNSVTARPERVIAQINLASPYVEKLICWEAPYYLIGCEDAASAELAGTVFSSPEVASGSFNPNS